MAARDSGMSTKVLRRLKMSLDYNTRSFAPLANFTKIIFPLLSEGGSLSDLSVCDPSNGANRDFIWKPPLTAGFKV